MNFLAPFFLAGALAVGLPVLFHLIRRTTRERTVFSSLMFLRPTPPRLTRRSRLENLLLLLLRCAAICLLAFGFARPFLKHTLPVTPASEPPQRLLLLVDTSASMRRADLWTQARDRVRTVLAATKPSDQAALYTFDRQLTPVISFEEWNSLNPADRAAAAASRLAGSQPGWASTRLDQAVVRAAELLSDADTNAVSGGGTIVIVSDFQSGSQLGVLQGQDWPRGVQIRSEPLLAKTSNAGLQLLAATGDTASSSDDIRLRVSTAADSTKEQFKVGWSGADGRFLDPAQEVYVPAGQSRIVTLARLAGVTNANCIRLQGDDEPFDNQVFSAAPNLAPVPVVYLGNESATNSREALYFVLRAFEGAPRNQIEVLPRPPTVPLPATEAESAGLFIVTAALPEPAAALVRGQLERGKTALFAPTSAEAVRTLGFVVGQPTLQGEDAVPRNHGLLGEIDFRHPLFSPFADARYSDFSKIHFWSYRRVDATSIPNARVVARFDNGDAAILDIPVSRGHVIWLASSWRPADSQLALSTKFVPLLYSVLELGGAAPSTPASYSVGDSIPLPSTALQTEAGWQITDPDQSVLHWNAGETNFTQATLPGIYRMQSGSSHATFAVNLDATESRTAPLPLDELERLGVPTVNAPAAATMTAQNVSTVQNAELESQQKLWRWFIVGTLAVLLLETGIAGWSMRKQSMKAGVAA